MMDEAWMKYCSAQDALMSTIKNGAIRAERERILAIIDKGKWFEWDGGYPVEDKKGAIALLKAAITEGQQ